MMTAWLLLFSANAVGGAVLRGGAHHGFDMPEMLLGSGPQQYPNSTTGHQSPLQPLAAAESIREYYDGHDNGRGMWKWANALDAYDQHFGGWAQHQLSIGEVGVQSGGSIEMWQNVLGKQIHVYGFDINKKCTSFANSGVTITIGDQAEPQMWRSFFQELTSTLDILIDDGGHESHQMLTTMYEVFPHISSGGFLIIEDIHGPRYMDSFFAPAAKYIGEQAAHGLVDSVHVYPFLLIVQKAGPNPRLPALPLKFNIGAVVDSFKGLNEVLPNHMGSAIELRNPGWGSFLTGISIKNLFGTFMGLHDYAMVDKPSGCATTSSVVCTAAINNSPMQNFVSGIHIYKDRLVVEVTKSAPSIQAVRKGTKFIGYGL